MHISFADTHVCCLMAFKLMSVFYDDLCVPPFALIRFAFSLNYTLHTYVLH